MNTIIEKCPVFNDHRGDLIQFVSQQTLQDHRLSFGQVYLITFSHKFTVRGNHYHNHSREIFCLISGSVEMVFEDVESKERMRHVFSVGNNEFYRIYVGARTAHAIKSLTDFAVMVSFSSKEFDLYNQDKILYPLM